jgi:spore coat protein A
MSQLTPFLDDLPIPPVVKPFGGIFGALHLAMKAKVKYTQLHSDLPPTKVWSYRLDAGTFVNFGSGSTYLGPTVVVNRDELVKVRWQNKIPENQTLPYDVVKVPYSDGDLPIPQNHPGKMNALAETQDSMRGRTKNLKAAFVTHLHGGRSQADSDGWPDDTVVSGQTGYYTYHNQQAASMLWYHDHANHVTRLNVFAGLAGAWLIRDEEESLLNLPDGNYELPLIIQDRNLDTDDDGHFTGALLHKTEVNNGPAEFFGPYTLVNGKIWPKACVEPRLYRLRMLNGSNARTYRLLFLDDQGKNLSSILWQIGCDQGLTKEKIPFPEKGLIMMPGERVDLLVDFSAVDFSPKQTRSLYLWNIAEAPFSDDNPTNPDAGSELRTQLQHHFPGNPNAEDRRPYPQVMRFDVSQEVLGVSHTVPIDPLWQLDRPKLDLRPKMPIRLMALVEKPAGTINPDGTPKLDGTAMLVFWEYIEIEEADQTADSLTFNFIHPATGVPSKKYFRKAAEEFYDRVNWAVHLNDTEQWYIVNVSPDTHPVHVHLVDMTVNQRFKIEIQPLPSDPEAPPFLIDGNVDALTDITATMEINIDADQTGPKDTVRINPGEMIGVAMKFSPYCGKYIYHCHILEHEDHDMMRPFTVVPGWIPHHED